MVFKLLTEHQLEFLSLKGGSSESTLVKKHSCKSHVTAHISFTSSIPVFGKFVGIVLLMFQIRPSLDWRQI